MGRPTALSCFVNDFSFARGRFQLSHAPKNPAVLSYYTMRRAVGVTALTLPFVLAFGHILFALFGSSHGLPHPLIERSISDYYHTPMRNYLVGSLCAVGAFLACTRGYDLRDEIAGYIAGSLAIVVAIVPAVNPHHPTHSRLHEQLGRAHLIAAALMYLALAYFCLVLFRQTAPGKPLTRRKGHRNRVYLVCGLVIVACMSVMFSLTIKSVQRMLWPTGVIFWCESLGLMAFGVAWLVKGEVFLRDSQQNHNHQNHDHQEHDHQEPGGSDHPHPAGTEPARAKAHTG